MLISCALIIIGLVFLIWSAERLVFSASALAYHTGVSPLMIGLTIVAFGTSAPEIFVSAMSAWEGNSNIAIGNVIGSNIMNVALVLGLTAAISPIRVQHSLLRKELPILVIITLIAGILLYDKQLQIFDGLILVSLLVSFLVWLYYSKKSNPSTETIDDLPESIDNVSNKKAIIWLIISLILLPVSAKVLVTGAVQMAQILGLSELFIGLTIIAIGTSLPELATAIASMLKKQDNLALGNIVGSNIFNLLAVLPFPAFLNPGTVDIMVIHRDYPFMLLLTLGLFFAAYSAHRTTPEHPHIISRIEGGIFLGVFGVYTTVLLMTSL